MVIAPAPLRREGGKGGQPRRLSGGCGDGGGGGGGGGLLRSALCPWCFGCRPWCFGRHPWSFGSARPRGTTGGQVNRNRLDVTRGDVRTALASHPPDRG